MQIARGRASQLWRLIAQESPAVLGQIRRMSSSEPIVNKKLVGKTAIITGGASGFGAATAKLFAAHGAQVVLADINDTKGLKMQEEIGAQAHFRHCNVSKEEDLASTVDFTVEKFGKLDIMFNNAGIMTQALQFETLDLSSFDRTHSIMVRGVVAGIKHAARVMIPVKQGVILTTASSASAGVAAFIPIEYNVAKQFLPGLIKVAAVHMGLHGIRVNVISPHAVLTPLVTDFYERNAAMVEKAAATLLRDSGIQGKVCTVEDIANGALFLCSDDSSFVTGQNLIIDGGWSNQVPHVSILDDDFSLLH